MVLKNIKKLINKYYIDNLCSISYFNVNLYIFSIRYINLDNKIINNYNDKKRGIFFLYRYLKLYISL